jgi:hypothetical protein
MLGEEDLQAMGPKVLIVDKFAGHCTAKVRDDVAECGAFLELIPGGYTWCLQVMDVGCNKPFRDGIQNSFDNFCVINDFNQPQNKKMLQFG